MTILLLGATGATGQLLARELLRRGHHLRLVVRALDRLPGDIRTDDRVAAWQADLLDLGDAELARLVQGCDAVASCLGHNLTLRGLFGHPRRLVADTLRRVCEAIRANNPPRPVKCLLMNTTGNRNRDLDEPVSLAQNAVVAMLRLFLPPHADNEAAADYLRRTIGQRDPGIEWVAVRPDGLVNETTVSDYELHASPQRSAIFDAGTTSRINVADLMARLIAEPALWATWRGRMPVIYNIEPEG